VYKGRNVNNRLDRDWSHVVAMASVAGISPRVISRAATRCSAIFNETMAFRTMPEGAGDAGVLDPVAFQPTDFTDKSAEAKLDEQRRTWWDVEEGCPVPSCRWYGRKDYPSVIMKHMRSIHKWDPLPLDLDFEADVTGMIGGVHVDGFLRPVEPLRRTRGKDKNEGPNKNRSAAKFRYGARVRAEREREREARNGSKKQKTETETIVLEEEK
jgi:hypothetical protein